MARNYDNYYVRQRPPNFPIFLPWSGAGYAAGWAMIWDIPLGSMVTNWIYGEHVNGYFALGWFVLFPFVVYLLARAHFDNTQYENVWAERIMVRKWVWGVIVLLIAQLFL